MFFIGCVLFSLAGFFLAFFLFAKKASKTLLALDRLSRKIAEDGVGGILPIVEGGEASKISVEFQHMLDKIRSDFVSLSEKIKEYEMIISKILDPLFVLDDEGRIVFFNDSFRSLIGNNIRVGQYYWEAIREPTFTEFFNEHTSRIKENKTEIRKELKLKSKHFDVTGSFVRVTGERFYIFRDVTPLVEVERMKRDFISNLSHELRTPLSAMKGFIETLESDDSIKERSYVEIIKRNTERLIRMVNDLLTLSRLEEGYSLAEFEEVDLRAVVEPVLKLFERRIQEKGLDLIVDIGEDVKIRGDRFQLEQLFINLIDNAVKYTEKGYVKVQVKRENDSVLINVEDSGIGIPEKHQSRIFERFYVVDKSRSKRHDGTGLGLSIVKHIVMLHNGTIKLRSSPGEGSEFSIYIPVITSTKN